MSLRLYKFLGTYNELACEQQTFLLTHRCLGTVRETSLSGEDRGETSTVRRLTMSGRKIKLLEVV